MLDKVEIYKRFAACQAATTPAQIARIFGVSRPTASRWKSGLNPIPLKYLKQVADKYCVTWDWLMDGKEPQHRQKQKGKECKQLNRHDINNRFLSLFPRMSQAKIAEELEVKQTSVFRWCNDRALIARESLKYAVDNKNVTWEWLIEGW